MRINILKKGDNVIQVGQDFVAVKRKNGEVDIIPFVIMENGVRIDHEHITTIGFGSNTVEIIEDDVTTTYF